MALILYGQSCVKENIPPPPPQKTNIDALCFPYNYSCREDDSVDGQTFTSTNISWKPEESEAQNILEKYTFGIKKTSTKIGKCYNLFLKYLHVTKNRINMEISLIYSSFRFHCSMCAKLTKIGPHYLGHKKHMKGNIWKNRITKHYQKLLQFHEIQILRLLKQYLH